MSDAEPEWDWYIVHPGVPIRRAVTQGDWLLVEDDLREWADRLDDDEQEEELVALWTRVCDYAERCRVDEVVVSSIYYQECLRQMENWGFAVRRHRGRLTFSGESSDTVRLLRQLRKIVSLRLTASVRGVELIRVRDDSWDPVYVYTDSPEFFDRSIWDPACKTPLVE